MPSLWIGLSSIHWREAWKYGERAFRYCQLDIGHALGALRYAAGALGWQIKLVCAGGKELASLLGLNRDQDFANAEREDADLLLAVIPHPVSNDTQRISLGTCGALSGAFALVPAPAKRIQQNR